MLYRYELQGPNALALLEAEIGRPVPATPFFGMARFEIAGVEVRSLRHGMAGQPGFELFGQWEDGERLLAALLEAGPEHELVRAGARACSSANLESAWAPSPLPAISTGKRSAEHLDRLPANRIGSLTGSLVSDRIEGYCLTPYDLGYGRTVSFEHEFIGCAALERHAETRRKVTLVWHPEDEAAVQRSLFEPGLPAKYPELPKARYGVHQVDRVERDGEVVGISHDVGHTVNEHAFASLASIHVAHAEPGTEVTVVWGEAPNSVKPAVEPHRQVSVRATVEPAPYSACARERYRARPARSPDPGDRVRSGRSARTQGRRDRANPGAGAAPQIRASLLTDLRPAAPASAKAASSEVGGPGRGGSRHCNRLGRSARIQEDL